MYDLWKGNVMILKPSCYACNIASQITCDLCPFKIKRCKFASKIPKGTYVFKNIKNFGT
jgi:hypothetical protein